MMFEGSRLEDPSYTYLSEGAYGVVFVNKTAGRIRKVAYRKQGADDAHCREVFDAEIKALKTAENSEILRTFVAAPIHAISGVSVVDRTGRNISDQFYEDLAFEAAFIPGQFVKIGTIGEPERSRVINLFNSAGIAHVCDASVIFEGQIKKVIDFALKEIELFWE